MTNVNFGPIVNEKKLVKLVQSKQGQKALTTYEQNCCLADHWHNNVSDNRLVRLEASVQLAQDVKESFPKETSVERLVLQRVIQRIVDSKINKAKETLDKSGLKFTNLGTISESLLRASIDRETHKGNAQRILDEAIATEQKTLTDAQKTQIAQELGLADECEIARQEHVATRKKAIHDNETLAAQKGVLSEYLYYYGNPVA